MATSNETNPAQAWLVAFVQQHGGVAGSVHRLSSPDELTLAAALNLPPPVVAAVQRVPRGKGMAGLALAQNQPISTCNLQADTSGQVRPGAKAVAAQAAVALPVHNAAGSVRAVVGIAFSDERTIDDEGLRGLAAAAASLPA